MKNILDWSKRPFLLICWFFKRLFFRASNNGLQIVHRKKKVYETSITNLSEYNNKSPLDQISAPPWNIRISGAILILKDFVITQMYHAARSNRYKEICGFVLGKRFGELFIGETFVEITNSLHSRTKALEDVAHVQDLKEEIASRYPDLQIVSTVHSHPNGVLCPSEADIRCFLRDDHPNIIVSPLRLYRSSPVDRIAVYYHYAGAVRQMKLVEIFKKDTEIEDINLDDLKPSKADILKARELSAEIDFNVFRIHMVFNPKAKVKDACEQLSKEFGDKIRFNLLSDDGDRIFNPDMNIVDFFLSDGKKLVYPELFGEVKNG